MDSGDGTEAAEGIGSALGLAGAWPRGEWRLVSTSV